MNYEELDNSFELKNININDEYTDDLLGIFVVSFNIKQGNLIGKPADYLIFQKKSNFVVFRRFSPIFYFYLVVYSP
jgi:hypothetical protein